MTNGNDSPGAGAPPQLNVLAQYTNLRHTKICG
jgi:hypothetical protein